MLPSSTARDRFTEWHKAARILVYDADSASLAEGGNVLGLLRKFRNEGYSRDVAFVKGGFHAIWRDMPSIIDTTPPPREDEDDGLPAMSKSLSAPAAAPALRTKHLPMSAFTLSSTAAASQPSLSLSQRRTMHLHSLSLSQPQSEVSLPSAVSLGPRTHLSLCSLCKPLNTHHAQAQVIPPTPMAIRADPFSTLAPLASTSASASLRLPPTKEGVATAAFPQYPDPTSLPTLSPQTGLHLRPHYNSLPPAPAVSLPFSCPSVSHQTPWSRYPMVELRPDLARIYFFPFSRTRGWSRAHKWTSWPSARTRWRGECGYGEEMDGAGWYSTSVWWCRTRSAHPA